MGNNVGDGELFEALLEDRLNREFAPGHPWQHVEILNFAVDGMSLPQQLALQDDRVFQFDPDVVIDVATLKPLDAATIVNSVRRTGRLVIVHEAPLTGGFGAEIAARVACEALTSLLAPIERVAGYDTAMPYSRLEAFYMPDADRIASAARRAVSFQ